MTGLRLVLADDELLVRQGLRLVLELDPGLEVVGEAGDGVEAVAVTREHRPDLALLDVRMPRLDGVEAARRICADPALSGTRVVMLTTFADESLLVDAVRAGASGYLLKSMPPEDIRAAVRSAAGGQTAVAPVLVDRLLREYSGLRTDRSPLLDRLTERETDVLRQVATGRSNAEIGLALYLGEGTVKTHVASVLRKLGVRDRTQAAVAAYELGLVRPGGTD
ncbi:MAG: response regulator transcription factor [Actinomycetales bacterium]|nr:response regulator transcription factor [Actinomycetales bacterium]